MKSKKSKENKEMIQSLEAFEKEVTSKEAEAKLPSTHILQKLRPSAIFLWLSLFFLLFSLSLP